MVMVYVLTSCHISQSCIASLEGAVAVCLRLDAFLIGSLGPIEKHLKSGPRSICLVERFEN